MVVRVIVKGFQLGLKRGALFQVGRLSFLLNFYSFLALSKKDLIGIEILLRSILIPVIKLFLAALLILSIIILWLAKSLKYIFVLPYNFTFW